MQRRRALGLSVVVALVGAVLATGLLANPTGAAADDADEVLLVQPNGRWHIRQPVTWPPSGPRNPTPFPNHGGFTNSVDVSLRSLNHDEC